MAELHYKNPDGSIGERWNGEPIGDTQYPRNIDALWSDAELAALGLYRLDHSYVDASTGPDTATDVAQPVFDGTRFVVVRTLRDKTQTELDAEQQTEIDSAMAKLAMGRSIDKAIGQAIHILLNRIEVLENTVNGTAKSQTTWQQFITWFRNQIN